MYKGEEEEDYEGDRYGVFEKDKERVYGRYWVFKRNKEDRYGVFGGDRKEVFEDR